MELSSCCGRVKPAPNELPMSLGALTYLAVPFSLGTAVNVVSRQLVDTVDVLCFMVT